MSPSVETLLIIGKRLGWTLLTLCAGLAFFRSATMDAATAAKARRICARDYELLSYA